MSIDLRSTSDTIKDLADTACKIATDYFNNHSRIALFLETEFDERPGHLMIASDDTGREQQALLGNLMDKIALLCDRLNCGEDIAYQVEECRSLFTERCRPRGFNHFQPFEDACIQIKKSLDTEPDTTPDSTLLVVDTNSLLRNPEVDTWTFHGIPEFTMVVPSTVLSEIDSFENSNKNDSVRQKADKLVKQFKEYRRRGRLHEGVNIRTGLITLMVLPLEPVFDEFTSGLDPGNNDDRIIAKVLGLIREHPKCAIALVTRDTNLQNKADYRNITTLEPPEPRVADTEKN